MIDDMLDIVLDPLIPPTNDVRNNRQNDFQLIYCEGNSVYSSKPVNLRAPFSMSPYPFPELDPRPPEQRLEQKPKTENEPEVLKAKVNKARAASVESQNNESFVYLSSVENIYKALYAQLHFRSDINPTTVCSHLTKILSILTNWELLSDKHITLACKSLLLIANSAASIVLADQNYIISIAQLISSGNVKLEIQLAAVYFFV